MEDDLTGVELTDGLYSDNWLVQFGEWESREDGFLKKGDGVEGGLLLRVPVITGGVRVEYEAMSMNPGDMSLFMGTRAHVGNRPARAAFFGVGSRGNTINRISLPDGETVESTDPKIAPGQWHRIAIERAAGRLSLEVDGKRIVSAADSRTGFAGPHIMLYAYNETKFRSVRVWRRDDPALEDYLADPIVKREQKWRGRPIVAVPYPNKQLKRRPSPFNIVGRTNIYKQLRSFDHDGLSKQEFETQALKLFSPSFDSAEDLYKAFLATKHLSTPAGRANVELADEVLRNVFTFYGEKYDLGETIDWERNPGNDHWAQDLNRFSYIPILCHASRETGDDRYVKKAAELILDWVASNDVCDAPDWDGIKERSPYVWSSYLNIAIHLGRWTAHIDQIAPHMTPQELLKVLKSVHDQAAWLEEVIPTRVNNWVVIGSGGLINTSTRLREMRDSDRWMAFAWDQMKKAADAQVLPDGAQFELTPHYHLVVARLYIQALKSSSESGAQVPDWVKPVISKMLDYSMQTVTPADTLLAFNDSDPAGGPGARSLLADIGRKMGRPDWVYVGTKGEEGTKPGMLSQAFEYAGVYVMRSGWGTNDSYLAFDGGPWGASHQHDDKLSFVLSGLGRDFIVDPGRYLYDHNNPYSGQNYLNATVAHSTITADGQSQADRDFIDTHVPGPRLDGNVWESEDGHDHVRSTHDLGYGRAGAILASHTRDVHMWHPDVVLIQDLVDIADSHEIVSRLQFAPGDLVRRGDLWVTDYPDANIAVLPWMDADFEVSVKKGQLDPPRGWYSRTINQIEPSPTLEVAARSDKPLRGAFLMVMYRGTEPPTLAMRVEGNTLSATVDGRSFSARMD